MSLILSGTDGLSDVDGTAATPAIRGTDANTGIFFPAADTIAFAEGGAEVARFDSSGNFGLGVTPTASSGLYKVVEVGASGNSVRAGTSDQDLYVSCNLYYNSGWKFGGNGYGALYNQYHGTHSWAYTASNSSGAGASASSLTTAMTLDASGNLGVGTTSPISIGVGYTSITVSNATTGGGIVFAQTGTQKGAIFNAGNNVYLDASNSAGNIYFRNTGTGATTTIDSSGNLIAATSNATLSHKLSKGAVTARFQLQVGESYPANFYEGSAYGFNVAATVIEVSKNNATSRSINAGGTINASGADYAEYMTKAGNFTIAKGDVVGIDAQGKLTNVFADAVSFVVKSSNPSFVGGDVWGNEEALGLTRPTSESTQAEKDAFDSALEIARQRVDRIAFSGQVPVNVMGATAGQYIVPVNDNGAIKGEAVSNPTFEQYQISVGKVISIESDGRAKIIVKVA